MTEYCEMGVKEGARLLHGGKRCDRPGNTELQVFLSHFLDRL